MQEFFKNLQLIKKSQWKDDNYYEKCNSYAYGFYALIRTSLHSARRFSDEVQAKKYSEALNTYREKWKDDIEKILDIASDKALHPLENAKSDTWYELGGLDSTGAMDIYEWSVTRDTHLEIYKINPLKDIQTAHNYLEGLADTYLEIIKN